MKALTLVAPKSFQFGDVADPDAGDDDVVVAVRACGICGSDVHGMDGSSGRRIPPIIMGHEASGVIVSVGPAVSDWQPGDRVTFDSTEYCGRCDSCRAGRVNLCSDRRVLGVSCGAYRRHGAFAERVAVPARILYPIPDSLGFEEACFVEPCAVALHAVRRMPITGGEFAVVIGAGIIGLLIVQCLKLAGCSRVLAVDLDPRRLELASRLGADDVMVSDQERVLAFIRETTAGRGADLTMEAVGITPTVRLAVESVRAGGAVGLVGNIAPNVDFPLQRVVTGEITLFGSCSSAGEYPEVLSFLNDGLLRVEPLISAVAELADGATWFDRLHDNQEGLVKVILRP